MATIKDDDGYFARKPWALPVFFALAALTIGIDVVDGNTLKTVGTVGFMSGMFGMLMLRRTKDRRYRWLVIIGFGMLLITVILRVGTRLNWW